MRRGTDHRTSPPLWYALRTPQAHPSDRALALPYSVIICHVLCGLPDAALGYRQADKAGITAPPLRLDSQCKYGAEDRVPLCSTPEMTFLALARPH